MTGWRSCLCVLFLAGVALPALHAQTASTTCGLQDMKGAWVGQPFGVFVKGASVPGPYSSTGAYIFDGAGKFTGSGTSSTNGKILFPAASGGSYTLTAACKLTMFDTIAGVTFDGWLVNDKVDVIAFEKDPFSVTPNSLHRQNTPSCSLTSVQDIWSISTFGYVIATGGRYAWNAHLTFDGKGGVTGIASKSDNGVIATDLKYTGAYTVNTSDCSFTLKVTDSTGVASSYYGSLFDTSKQFLLISNADGLVVAGYGKRP